MEKLNKLIIEGQGGYNFPSKIFGVTNVTHSKALANTPTPANQYEDFYRLWRCHEYIRLLKGIRRWYVMR